MRPYGSSKGKGRQKRGYVRRYIANTKSGRRFRQNRTAILSPRLEIKQVDIAINNLGIGSTGSKQLLNGLLSGAGFNQRLGSEIKMINVSFKGLVAGTLANAVPENAQLVRLLVVYDRQPNGAAFATSDVLQDVDFNSALTTTAYAKKSLVNKDRFMLLHDQSVTLPYMGINGAVGLSSVTFIDSKYTAMNFNVNLKQLNSSYSLGNTGSITDIKTGSLYFMALGQNNPGAGTNAWAFQGYARVRYID